MNYWMTTHWPPKLGEDPNNSKFSVYLPDDRKMAGDDFKAGDLIIIYQSKKGRTEVFEKTDGSNYVLGCQTGKMGVIAICKATSDVYKLANSKPSKYYNGKVIWWRWKADLKLISQSGFVSRKDTNLVLGYKANHSLRGFGDYQSGLKKLKKDQFVRLLKLFKSGLSIKTRDTKKLSSHTYDSNESDAHRLLKEYIGENPVLALSEEGLTTIEVEYQFPTMDRADVMLSDKFGRVLGIEIEVSVEDDQYEGILQAIKYRFMGELMLNRKPGDSRAILVAYKISNMMKKICNEYNVEYFEMDKSVIDHWASTRTNVSA